MPGINTEGLPAEVVEFISNLETQNSELATQLSKSTEVIEALIDASDEGDDDSIDADDDIQKALAANPALATLIAKSQTETAELRKSVEQAETIAKAERDARLTQEYISKATKYTALPGVTADGFGPILKSVAEKLSAEEFEALVSILDAASGTIAENNKITEEIGKSGALYAGNDDTLSKAAAEIAKSEGVDPIVALAKAALANPAAYEASRTGGK
jgi:hypothetical protein